MSFYLYCLVRNLTNLKYPWRFLIEKQKCKTSHFTILFLCSIACDLVTEGVSAIFGPGSPHTRGIVSSTAAKFDIPHIEYSWRSVEESDTPPTTINLYPDSQKISQVSVLLRRNVSQGALADLENILICYTRPKNKRRVFFCYLRKNVFSEWHLPPKVGVVEWRLDWINCVTMRDK